MTSQNVKPENLKPVEVLRFLQTHYPEMMKLYNFDMYKNDYINFMYPNSYTSAVVIPTKNMEVKRIDERDDVVEIVFKINNVQLGVCIWKTVAIIHTQIYGVF